MLIGIPRETKTHEYRVSAPPAAVQSLVAAGHQVLVEQSAGTGSGFDDDAYRAAGGAIVDTAAEAWAAPMVLKVKEPTPAEYGYLRDDLVLFPFLHLLADRPELRKMIGQPVNLLF